MAPNIVFILIDDMGWRDLSCYGSKFYETPHIDNLSKEAMTFSDAYASCPVCSPTRASILTGKYPATVNITNFIAGNACGKLMGVPYFRCLPKSEVTLAATLKQGGYRTYHVGKWHLGDEGYWPEDFGFDVNFGGGDEGAPYAGGYFSPFKLKNLPDGPDGTYLTDHLTTEAVRLIRENGESPFFLHLSHYAVHEPIQAPADLVEKYKRKAIDMGLDDIDTFETGEYYPSLCMRSKRIRRRLVQSNPAYAAMIENLDSNIGRVLDAIEETGKAENTIVVFTSDNGGLSSAETSPTCNAPLSEGKGWMYDGGVRVPLLFRWPKLVAPGTTCAEPCTSTDFYPTFLQAAGLPAMPEQHSDGVSILPLLRGEEFCRGPIFWHYPHYSNQGDTPACAIRDGDWKLIEHFEDNRIELFHIREDLGEDNDLAAERPDLVRELHNKLVAWRESIEAKIPEPNPHYGDMVAGRMPIIDNYPIPDIPGDDHL